jgi:hypothetical protein
MKRQAKQSRDEIRSLMLKTGRLILIEDGFGIGVNTITFKRVFERIDAETGIKLSNASVTRRVWENQADYQADVLALIAAEDALGEFDQTVQALGPVLESLDLSTPEARLRSLREVSRVGGSANSFMLLESPNWSMWLAVWAMATSNIVESQTTEYQRRIRTALVEGYEGFTTLWEGAYAGLAALLGLRAKAPLTFRQLSVAVGALAEGCSLRQRVDTDLGLILRPTGPNDELEEWTLFAVGLEALLMQFLELDPDWSPA